ncbi:MAG TPA: choice-of-anchor P family protein [Ktedonobacteraceae bacterium]|nr:choice-of-anchor P family protein [Ktedonobacteraceae bacterium]
MKRFVVVLVALLAMLAVCGGTAHASSYLPSIPGGYAYAGSVVPAGNGRVSGPFAPSWEGCQGAPGTSSNSVGSLSLPSYVQSGAASDQVSISRTALSSTSQAVSTVQNASLLNGLITASEIRAVASSTVTTTGASSTSAGSQFAGLRVAGTLFLTMPKPNTTIKLAGIGYVVLNEQNGSSNAGATYLSVNMIDVHVTVANSPGIPVGTQMVIGHASSDNVRTLAPSILGARAFGSYAKGGTGQGSLASGPLTVAGIYCRGGSSQSNETGTNVPSVGSTGNLSVSASGQIQSSSSQAKSTASVSNVNLLQGLLSVGKLNVTNSLFWDGSFSQQAGTTLIGATINGKATSQNPTPNTLISLPGLGYVVLNEQDSSNSATGTAQYVIGIDIHVTTANSLGLPVGTEIMIGYTETSINTY